MAKHENFDQLYQRACERKGGAAALETRLTTPLNHQQLMKITDDRWLAEFTKKVFQSGFVWRVVRDKWPDFERVFFEFNIDKVLLMPDEMLEQKATDPSIIRNYNKVRTVRDNAMMIDFVRKEHGSFASFIADWPCTDITGLWAYLKKHGARLGGNTGPYSLRAVGKDTFLFSRDVEQYLVNHGIYQGGITSKTSLSQIQAFFNQMHEQSGRSLQEISQIIAFSVGDNN